MMLVTNRGVGIWPFPERDVYPTVEAAAKCAFWPWTDYCKASREAFAASAGIPPRPGAPKLPPSYQPGGTIDPSKPAETVVNEIIAATAAAQRQQAAEFFAEEARKAEQRRAVEEDEPNWLLWTAIAIGAGAVILLK